MDGWFAWGSCGCEVQLHRGNVRKSDCGAVFGGQYRLLHRPLDTDVRIIPKDRVFGRRVVKVGALVSKQGGFAGDTETMGESGRDVELAMIIGRQGGAKPAAP